MAKYMADVSGTLTEIQALIVSAGVADASKIVQTDASGRLDISLMPVGVGAEVVVVPSFENLTAGNFINLFDNSGAVNSRKADATTSAKPAVGFVLSNVTSPAISTVYGISTKNTALSALTLGVQYWLAISAGGVTLTAPNSSGNIVQRLGTSSSLTDLVFDNTSYWVKS